MTETVRDTLFFVTFALGVATASVLILSMAFDRFVALKSLPDRRASWTVGLAYLVTAAGLAFMAPELATGVGGYPIWLDIAAVPLLPLPAAIANLFYYRRNYRRRWVESAEELPDGGGLENDNWLVGLGAIAAVVVFAIVRVAFRDLMRR